MSEFRTFQLSDPMAEDMLCLEASAGTGKTYTIEGMVARLVAQEGIPIERLLVVTFTIAATAELKTRIRKVLHQTRLALERAEQGAVMAEDVHAIVPVLLGELGDSAARTEGVRRLSRAIEGFDEAQIATIHGFCNRALRENTFESGAPFGADPQQSLRPLLEEVAHDAWTRECHDADPRLLAYLGRHAVTLETLFNLTKEVAAYPDMPRVPPKPEDNGQLVPALDAFDAALDGLRARWHDEADQIATTLVEAAMRGDLSKGSYKEETVARKRAALEGWLYDDVPAADKASGVLTPFGTAGLLKGRVGAFKKADGTITHALIDEVDALLDAATPADEALAALSLRFMHAAADFAGEAIVQRKRERRILSFDDLLKMLRARVRGPEASPALVAALQGRYDIALIDEFQDTDPVQWDIFEAIFTGTGRRIIVVGDPKQAIYAFRGADIETYLRARTHDAMSVAELGTNHRSDAAVVDGITHLFRSSAGGDPFLNDKIQYTDVRAHHTDQRFFPGDGAAPGVVFSFLRRGAIGVPADKAIKTWNFRAPQRIVAAQIVQFLQSGAELSEGDGRRAVRPSDIAVLVRSNRNAQEVQEALRARGVPSTLRHQSSVFRSEEARELIQVLEAVLNPRRAGQVRRALLTRLLGQDVSTLASLASDEAAWTTWMELLGAWRRGWFDTGFATFARALTTTALPTPGSDEPLSIPARLLGWRDGERRITNLNHLIELLHEAALRDDLAPAALVEWLKRERANDSDNPEDQRQLRLESDGDAVTIVTVHKSKGLEYPFVWCPTLWSGVGVSDKKKVPLRFRDLDNEGLWTLDIGVVRTDPDKKIHVGYANLTNLSEATRQLYVAVTRAKHQVHILHGAMNSLGNSGLGHLLHPGDGKAAKRSDEDLIAHIQALASTSGGTIGVRDLMTMPSGGTLQRTAQGADVPQARSYERRAPLDTWWRRTSFSGLTKNKKADEAPVQDHDAVPEEDSEASVRVSPVIDASPDLGHDDTRDLVLRDFRGGTRVGTCIHEIYEHHDFQNPGALRELVARTLTAHRLDAEQWTDAVTENIQASLDTDLGLGTAFRLSDLPMSRRFDELDFVFPLRADAQGVISAKEIGTLIATHPGPGLPPGYGQHLQDLAFLPVRGFMVGSIDLIFEHEGRWYVVDYKSNNLGPHPADYTRSHMAETMSHSHYTLQYHIYSVALHRYLSWRLGADYRFDDHFGGVRYLFLRGMSPDYAPGTGVFADTPPRALVEALSALLGGDA